MSVLSVPVATPTTMTRGRRPWAASSCTIAAFTPRPPPGLAALKTETSDPNVRRTSRSKRATLYALLRHGVAKDQDVGSSAPLEVRPRDLEVVSMGVSEWKPVSADEHAKADLGSE